MSAQIVMDLTGDTRHEFVPTDEVAVKEAMERFNDLVSKGYTAAERTTPGNSKIVSEFNPTATETLFIPRLQGG